MSLTPSKLPPISHTFHQNYEQCPRKAYHINIARDLKREETKEMKWGIAVHGAFERRLNYGDRFPEGFERYEDFCHFPDTYEIKAELKLGMREDGTSCDFFDPDVWARGVIDVLCTVPNKPTAIIIDQKTGKVREDPSELELHAVLLKAKMPGLVSIKGWYNWLASHEMGTVHDLSNTNSKLKEMRATRAEMQRALALGERAFPPKQTPLCGWCPVKSCEFNPHRQEVANENRHQQWAR